MYIYHAWLTVILDPVDFTCELDECAQLVVDLQESGIITDHRKGFSKIKRSFSGKDFVDWIVQSKELGEYSGYF